jgi:predicted nucleotidyltransferase
MRNIYQISFDDVNFKGLQEIITAIKHVAEKYDKQFMLIGALVKEILLEVIHEFQIYRKTQDIDFAIVLSDWEQYDQIVSDLLQIEGFEKDPKQVQRLIYKRNRFIDIIPFGEIAAPSDEIRWPPDEDMVLSVLGFKEVYEHSIIFEFDKELSIYAASLEGLAILKIFAWRDRKHVSTKDAVDLGIIIQNYFDINIDEIYDDFWTWIEREGHNFDSLELGAKVLGYKIGQVLKKSHKTKAELMRILETEIANGENSSLIFYMRGHTEQGIQHEINYKLIIMLIEGLRIEK